MNPHRFTMQRGRPFTVPDLDQFPDDGNRYELIEGDLLISPAPGLEHQTAVLELAYLMHGVLPPDVRLIIGSFAVQPNENTQVQPDIVVAFGDDFVDENLRTAPLLAVEILSPDNSLKDFHLKKALYERLGTPSYWVVDPIDPALTAFELDENGRYQQIAEVEGDDAFEVTQPFPVRIVPSELLEG